MRSAALLVLIAKTASALMLSAPPLLRASVSRASAPQMVADVVASPALDATVLLANKEPILEAVEAFVNIVPLGLPVVLFVFLVLDILSMEKLKENKVKAQGGKFGYTAFKPKSDADLRGWVEERPKLTNKNYFQDLGKEVQKADPVSWITRCA